MCGKRKEQRSFLKSPISAKRICCIPPKRKNIVNNWITCIKNYQEVYNSYPKSKEAPRALFNAARLYTFLYKYSGKSTDLDEAVTLYRQLADQYKNDRLADDAQYRIGEIYYTSLNDATRAYVEFLKVDVNFPKGDMRPLAKKMIDTLAVKLRSVNEKPVDQTKG